MACKGIASRLRYPCAMCGKDFMPQIRVGGSRAQFCSKACFGASRVIRHETPCPICGKAAKEPRVFCSNACHNAHQSRNKTVHECKTCGATFKWSPSRTKNQNPTYCSVPCRTACPSWKRNAAIEGNLVQSRRKTPSKLELAGSDLLRRIDVAFEEQVLIDDRFLVDVYVPDAGLVIQWDGDYWHGYRPVGDNRPLDVRQAKRSRLDRSQDAYMTKHGYRVLRFWEHEVVRNPGSVAASVQAAVAGGLK